MQKGKKETIYSFMLSIASKGFTYLLLLVFANYFTKAAFGRASFVLSVYNLTFLFAFIGLTNMFTVWYIKKKDCSSIFYFLSILTGISIMAWIIVSIGHIWILPFALVIPFVFLGRMAYSILFARHDYHLAQLGTTLFILITLISIFFLTGLGKSGIIIGYSIGYVLSSLFSIYLTRKELGKIIKKIRIKFSSIKEYSIAALITSLITVSFAFLGWVDSTILGWLSTFENVAVYNIVGPVSNVLALVPLSLGAFLLTRTSELKNKKISSKVLSRILRVGYSLSFFMAIGIVSLLSIIFKIFFPKYGGNEIYVMILAIGLLLYGVYYLTYMYSIGRLQHQKALLPILTAAIINIVLDIVLIPKFGLYGITIATTLAHGVAFLMLTKSLGVKKETKKMLIPLVLIPLAFFMGYGGLILIPIFGVYIAKTKMIQKGDVRAVVDPIKEIILSFRKR